MLSVTAKILSPFIHNNNNLLSSIPTYQKSPFSTSKPNLKPISATLIPASPPPSNQKLYQPFRPPPSPIPAKYRSLDTAGRLDILANRLGLWFEYAPLIPSLYQEGFSPPTIEEATGISGVEQNRLVVGAQVRDSLVQSGNDLEIVASFDTGGAELLYEIRLLSVTQRAAAARFLVEKRLDAKGAQELARAMKDYPRRRGEKAWENFDYVLPGDCLSFLYYRQSREHKDKSEQRTAALQQALEVAESEKAKSVIIKDLEGDKEGKEGEGVGAEDGVLVPVVRLKMGEVAESSSVSVFPVCRGEEKEKEVLEAPWECATDGEFGMVEAEKAWKRWVVLPSWEPVARLGNGGVVVAFSDARVLPWKANRWYKEEAILVVADRSRKEVAADDGFYLVTVVDGGSGGDGLRVERGSALKKSGVSESLGTVVLVVRPPRDENEDPMDEEDWV